MVSNGSSFLMKAWKLFLLSILFICIAIPIHADEQKAGGEPAKNLGKVALLIFRENDAVKFFTTRKPMKIFSRESSSKKVVVMNEGIPENSLTSDLYGYALELVSREDEIGKYGLQLAKQKKRYTDYAYPAELTDLFDIYISTVLKNKGYEVIDFSSDRNEFNGLTWGEAKDRLLGSGADYVCVIDYGALSQWGRRILDENPFLYSDGVGAYIVCNIAMFDKAKNIDSYTLAAYGVAPYKIGSEDWYKSGMGVTIKNDILQKIFISNSNPGDKAEYFVFDNKAMKKAILVEEQKYINRDGDGATGSVRSLKYSILNLLKN